MRIVRMRIELPNAMTDAEAESVAYRLHEWIEDSRHTDTTCPLMSRGATVRTAWRQTRMSKKDNPIRCWGYVGGKQDVKGNR